MARDQARAQPGDRLSIEVTVLLGVRKKKAANMRVLNAISHNTTHTRIERRFFPSSFDARTAAARDISILWYAATATEDAYFFAEFRYANQAVHARSQFCLVAQHCASRTWK